MDLLHDGRANFYDRRGLPLPDSPPPLRGPEGAPRKLHGNGPHAPGPYTAAAACKFDRLIPWEVEAAALEALDDS